MEKDYTIISWNLPLQCTSYCFVQRGNYLVWDQIDIGMYICIWFNVYA